MATGKYLEPAYMMSYFLRLIVLGNRLEGGKKELKVVRELKKFQRFKWDEEFL